MSRFGHHPEAAIDYCCEVEALEVAAENHRLGFLPLNGQWDEFDRRIDSALRFRVGGDPQACLAKDGLRKIADVRGFVLNGEQGYEGQPFRRAPAREQFEPLKYKVVLVTPNGSTA